MKNLLALFVHVQISGVQPASKCNITSDHYLYYIQVHNIIAVKLILSGFTRQKQNVKHLPAVFVHIHMSSMQSACKCKTGDHYIIKVHYNIAAKLINVVVLDKVKV